VFVPLTLFTCTTKSIVCKTKRIACISKGVLCNTNDVVCTTNDVVCTPNNVVCIAKGIACTVQDTVYTTKGTACHILIVLFMICHSNIITTARPLLYWVIHRVVDQLCSLSNVNTDIQKSDIFCLID
jgi:hypothetical protein